MEDKKGRTGELGASIAQASFFNTGLFPERLLADVGGQSVSFMGGGRTGPFFRV